MKERRDIKLTGKPWNLTMLLRSYELISSEGRKCRHGTEMKVSFTCIHRENGI
jgi:hypothetical protein